MNVIHANWREYAEELMLSLNEVPARERAAFREGVRFALLMVHANRPWAASATDSEIDVILHEAKAAGRHFLAEVKP